MSDIGFRIDWNDPLQLGLIGGAGFLVLLLILLIAVLKAARQAGRAAEPLAEQVTILGQTVATLGQGQQQLVGGLTQVASAQVESQAKLLQTMEHRLEKVSARMGESLTTSATRTAHSLGELQQRLQAIDRTSRPGARLARSSCRRSSAMPCRRTPTPSRRHYRMAAGPIA
jgi:DNA recombination protein RmuC